MLILKAGDPTGFSKALIEAIGDEVGVINLSKRVTLDIKDINETETIEEVIKSLAEVLKTEPDTLKDGNVTMRKGFAGTQVVRVSLQQEDANLLLKKGRIKIGWVSCRVQERVEVVQCYRCFGYGHRSVRCTGEEKKKGTCYNCGGEGHIAKNCKTEARCLVCNDDGGGAGHRMGGRNCHAFLEELKRVRGQKCSQ